MKDVLVFIDAAFVNKLSKYFGDGEYLKFDIFELAKLLSRRNNLFCKHLFYYTAPPFLSENPTFEEIKMRRGYDKFVSSLNLNKNVTIKQGRCQRLKNNDSFEYRQKGVDALMVSGMMSVSIKFPKIKKIIIVTSDTDFCPIVEEVKDLGIEVVLCTYYEKKRNGKFSLSHHLIDCCNSVYYLTKEDFEGSRLQE